MCFFFVIPTRSLRQKNSESSKKLESSTFSEKNSKKLWNHWPLLTNTLKNNPDMFFGCLFFSFYILQDVLFGDFGEAAVLPCFGAAVCADLVSPGGSVTEPFYPGFIYEPLSGLS